MEKFIKLYSYIKKHPVLFAFVSIAAIIWGLVLYKIFIDEVSFISSEIGAAFAK